MNGQPMFTQPCDTLDALLGTPVGTVGDVLNARVRASPDATFLLIDGQPLTFATVARSVSSFASYLNASAAMAPRVASFLKHGAEAITVMLGTHVSGATFAAINPQLRGSVLADRLTRFSPTILVTEAAGADAVQNVLPDNCKTILFTDNIPVGFYLGAGTTISTLDAAVGASDHTAVRSVSPESLASVIFTSGTTGRPKAVRVPHNYLCRGAARLVEGFKLREQDVIHAWLPLSHVSGQLYCVMTALVSGASLALFPRFSAGRFWDQVCAVDATFIIGFSNVAKILMESSAVAARRHKLRIALLAGLTPELTKAFEDRFAVRIVQAYGMTEAEPITVSRVDSREPLGSLGRPAPDFDVIVADELDRPLPAGSVGRILARPRAPFVMMDGYEGDAEATTDACRNLWFHSQDLGWLDSDGYLFFADRVKHAIRRRGENISAWEIEGVLRTHIGVAECAVVGVPSPLGEQEVKAVIVPAVSHRHLTPADLHEFCRAQLPLFMVPRYIEFRSHLPMTELGKVARDALDTLGDDVWDAEAASH